MADDGETDPYPVHSAARYGDTEDLVAWLNYAPEKVNEKNESGNTALHMACANNHYECVATLLDRGANANLVNAEGNTPLHWSAMNGAQESTQIIVLRGAAVNAINSLGETALDICFRLEKMPVYEFLLKHNALPAAGVSAPSASATSSGDGPAINFEESDLVEHADGTFSDPSGQFRVKVDADAGDDGGDGDGDGGDEGDDGSDAPTENR